MREIYLHGDLAKFGDRIELDVDTAAEAIRALCVQLEGFEDAVRSGSWQVVRGSNSVGMELDEESLWMGLGKASEVHIMPAISGAGSSGAGKVLLGGAMIGAAFFTGGASIAAWGATSAMLGAAGAGMLIAGTAMMLSPTPPSGSYENKGQSDSSSFLFNGPVNTGHQGVPVPLVYGEVITGSIVVSGGMTTERIPV